MPENTPAISAFLNLTFVLGININIAAKNSHVNIYDASLNKNEIIGDINSKSKMFCRVDVINIDNPLAHIIKIGSMSIIEV